MNNVISRGLVISALLGVGPVLIVGCDHHEHADSPHEARPGQSEPQATAARPAGAGDVASARQSIVAARCDREERCSNIGSGKEYESRDACSSKLDGKTGADLNTQDCSHGVDRPKLTECISKIRGEDCGNPIDSLSRLAACRTGAICISG